VASGGGRPSHRRRRSAASPGRTGSLGRVGQCGCWRSIGEVSRSHWSSHEAAPFSPKRPRLCARGPRQRRGRSPLATLGCLTVRSPSDAHSPHSVLRGYEVAQRWPHGVEQPLNCGAGCVDRHRERDQRGGEGRVPSRMSRDAVDRLLRHGGPDHRVADGGRAGSGFAHLGSWRRGGALERSYDRGDYEQRHEVRVLPGHSEHPRHDAVACLVQQPERDYRVADKQAWRC